MAEDIHMTRGEKLRARRLRFNPTIYHPEAAKILKISVSRLAHIENNDISPSDAEYGWFIEAYELHEKKLKTEAKAQQLA